MPEVETCQVLEHCHVSPYRGHHGGERIAHKALQSSFFLPTLFKDAINFVRNYDAYERIEVI